MAYLLQDFVSENAKKYPAKLMIQDNNDTITYGEMEKYTNKFAKFLIMEGVKRGDIITFYMNKSIMSFKSLIGIMKADAAYAPLNTMTPDERVHFILKDSKCKFIICNAKSYSKTLRLLANYNYEIKIINIDSKQTSNKKLESSNLAEELKNIEEQLEVAFTGDLGSFNDKKRPYQNIDLDLAYVMYTSGSTGLPKGVMISHRNVIDYAEWTVDFFDIGKDDRLSNHPGLYFDLSTFDLYSAFKSGASLHLVPELISMFPIKIIEFIEESKLTLWNSVPSLLVFIAKSGVLKRGRMPTLRTITFCGEVMPTQTVIEWMKVYPQIRYVNQYGPTETTCASMYYELKQMPEDPAKPIPIGIAIPNTEVFSINNEGEIADVGETGELYIRGSGNGLGYWNNEEKTKKAFIQHPLNEDCKEKVYRTGDLVKLREDGNYDFIGRMDNQIKYMGFRVELGEIESTLNSFDYISSSAVLGIENPEISGMVIIAFISLKYQVKVLKIKEDLGKKIPHYMIPKKIIVFDKLPLNDNRKINKLALKQMYLRNIKQ